MSRILRTITVSFIVDTDRGTDDDELTERVREALKAAVEPFTPESVPGLYATPDVV